MTAEIIKADDRPSGADYLLSVVVPMYNEEKGAAECVRRLRAVLADIGCRYELIFVNDGSSDSTLSILKSAKENDEHIRVVDFSRNFGHQIAITAGLDLACGDAIIIIDGDLQDPPELFKELIAKWQEGNDVVHARRRSRAGESAFKKNTAALYYRLVNEISSIELPIDVGDFRLISRRAQAAMMQLRERHRYVRGLVAWVGYKQAFVDYDRDKRFAGQTHYPLLKMMVFSWHGISSFSVVPLRLASYMGLFSALGAFFYGLYALYMNYIMHATVLGWTSIILLVMFLGGIQLISLGIIGEYLGMLFEESKQRPLYLVNDIY